jgi:hypothetical protein
MQHYLGGSLEQGEDEWKFVFEDGRIVSLSNLSSGSKELLPLFCVLEMYEHQRPNTQAQIVSGLAPENTYRSDDFYIEEPEGHIFPETQREVVSYFAELANSVELRTRITVTTHSPYLLTAFNALIAAGQTAKARPEETAEIEKIVPRQYWIKEGDLVAYAFNGRDGILHRMMDEETGLIDGDILDSVSDRIGGEFEELLDIEYGK